MVIPTMHGLQLVLDEDQCDPARGDHSAGREVGGQVAEQREHQSDAEARGGELSAEFSAERHR
jgi:hypothetical protein